MQAGWIHDDRGNVAYKIKRADGFTVYRAADGWSGDPHLNSRVGAILVMRELWKPQMSCRTSPQTTEGTGSCEP